MKPGEFLSFAEKVASASDSGPAGYRSAISRAYYGAFLNARHLIEEDLKQRWRIGTASEHEVVQRKLMNCQVQEAVEAGQLLSNLHNSRKQADYEMDDLAFEEQEEAQLCVDRAAEIIRRLQQCSAAPLRQRIVAGMLQFRRTANC